MSKTSGYRVWVVEIWWEHEAGKEWLYDNAFCVRKEAEAHAKEMRKSGYTFRVAEYARKSK